MTFISQSLSDPFGWGWDLFGTANIPWHQFVPRLVQWLQSVLILAGFWYSLRNLRKTRIGENLIPKKIFMIILPLGCFITATAVAMIFFFTN